GAVTGIASCFAAIDDALLEAEKPPDASSIQNGPIVPGPPLPTGEGGGPSEGGGIQEKGDDAAGPAPPPPGPPPAPPPPNPGKATCGSSDCGTSPDWCCECIETGAGVESISSTCQSTTTCRSSCTGTRFRRFYRACDEPVDCPPAYPACCLIASP